MKVRCPPLGSHRVDEEAVSIIRQWIQSLKRLSLNNDGKGPNPFFHRLSGAS